MLIFLIKPLTIQKQSFLKQSDFFVISLFQQFPVVIVAIFQNTHLMDGNLV